MPCKPSGESLGDGEEFYSCQRRGCILFFLGLITCIIGGVIYLVYGPGFDTPFSGLSILGVVLFGTGATCIFISICIILIAGFKDAEEFRVMLCCYSQDSTNVIIEVIEHAWERKMSGRSEFARFYDGPYPFADAECPIPPCDSDMDRASTSSVSSTSTIWMSAEESLGSYSQETHSSARVAPSYRQHLCVPYNNESVPILSAASGTSRGGRLYGSIQE